VWYSDILFDTPQMTTASWADPIFKAVTLKMTLVIELAEGVIFRRPCSTNGGASPLFHTRLANYTAYWRMNVNKNYGGMCLPCTAVLDGPVSETQLMTSIWSLQLLSMPHTHTHIHTHTHTEGKQNECWRWHGCDFVLQTVAERHLRHHHPLSMEWKDVLHCESLDCRPGRLPSCRNWCPTETESSRSRRSSSGFCLTRHKRFSSIVCQLWLALLYY